MDSSGGSYVAAVINSATAVSFDGNTVSSGAGADAFVAKYDTAGTAQWALALGSGLLSNPADAVGVAVTNDGTLAVVGRFSGSFSIGPSALSSGSPVDYVAGLSAADGAGLWALPLDNGPSGSLRAVAADPGDGGHGNLVAVCGVANGGAPTALVGPSGTALPYDSLVIGVFSSAGTILWANQYMATPFSDSLPTVSTAVPTAECDAVAVDDEGNVYAAGSFLGAALRLGTGATLTGPAEANAFGNNLWVAEFQGTNGAVKAAQVFQGGSNEGIINPTSLAVDSVGNLLVAGRFTISLSLNSSITVTSSGATDAFVAKFGAGLEPMWAVSLGGSWADSASGVAVDSRGDVLVTGFFTEAATGAATLAAPTTEPTPFLMELDGATGATGFAVAYDDVSGGASATGDGVAVNRFASAANQVALAGSFQGTLELPPAFLTATNPSGDVFLFGGQLK